MCLRITHVPQNKTDGLIGIGYKKLYYDCGYHTPVMGTYIPKNGWLIPDWHSKRKHYLKNHYIDGGHIHYYLHSDLACRYKVITFFNCAYDISSYNYYQEGVCKAMYIPHCDLVSPKETMSKIRRLLDRAKRGTLRTCDISRTFPFLSKSYETYKRIICV